MAKHKEIDYQKICLFCENATVLRNGDDLLCRIKGVVSEDYCCKKFIYDPLKRQPASPLKLPTIDKDDLL